MNRPKKNCAACGRAFIQQRSSQRYCSEACRRLGYRIGLCNHEDKETDTAIRTFTCARCGKTVKVTDLKDRRQRFCSEECRRMAAERGLIHPGHNQKQPEKQYDRQCPQCGAHFITRQATQKYCCPACKRQHERHAEPEHPEDETITDAPVIRTFCCKNCGKWISVTRKTDKREIFCSHKCEKNFYRKRPSERAAWTAKKARHARAVREAMKGGECHGNGRPG